VNWLVIALLGTAFFSAAGILDKYLLSSCIRDSRTYIVCQVLAQQLITIPVFFIFNIDFIYPASAFALIAGALQVVPSIYYLRATQVEEISRVSALEYLYPIFVFIGAAVMLGEALTLKHYAGGFLLLAGVLLASFRHGGPIQFNSLSPALKPFVFYWITTAIYYLALKCLLSSADEWNFYTWSCLGNLAASMPLLIGKDVRHEAFNFFKGGGITIGAIVAEESLQFLGIITTLCACAQGSVTLVTSIGALQPLMTLVMMLGIVPFSSRLVEELDECLDRCALIQKSSSFLIIVAGVYLIC
jgi:uncharacterized membrane protein